MTFLPPGLTHGPHPAMEQLVARHDAAEGPAILKAGPRGKVTRVPYDRFSDAVVKEDRPPTLRSKLGARLRGSRAARAFAAAAELRRAGFVAPEPLGLLELPERCLVAFRHVTGQTLGAAWCSTNDPFAAEQLACQAAALAARLHSAGFAFRDLKPSNLILGRELVPVDLDDVRQTRSVPRRIVYRNLAALDAYGQLSLHPLRIGSRWRALETYASLRDLDPEALLREVLPRSRAKRLRLVAT